MPAAACHEEKVRDGFVPLMGVPQFHVLFTVRALFTAVI